MAIGGSIQQIKETTEGAWLTNIEVKPSHSRKRSTVCVVYINQGIAKKEIKNNGWKSKKAPLISG
jgi:hypothetical protein